MSSLTFTQLRAVDERNNLIRKEVERIRRIMDFVPVTDVEEAEKIEQGIRNRGAYPAFVENVTKWYEETWKPQNEDKMFLLYLNRNGDSGDPFPGKLTDSLYQSINEALKKKNLRDAGWGLTKHDGYLILTKQA